MTASWRRLRRLARLAAWLLAVGIVAGLIGQLVRDRTPALALLMYIPLPMVGAFALALDVMRRGRSLPRFRFGLMMLGSIAIGWSAFTMIGWGSVAPTRPGDREVRVLHWNVLWGGGLFQGPGAWAAQRQAILDRNPELIVLNEAPPVNWIERLADDLGPDGSWVGIQHDPSSRYRYRLAVCSRWPLRMEELVTLPGGSGMSVSADLPGRRLRLLVVDGISAPARSRLPFLQAIAKACREAEASGRPFDLVVGDFNTPSRSLGFDHLEALGYRLAGRSSGDWRATFPAWLPVYDIDHTWLAPTLRLASCTFFSSLYSDHRGEVVRLLIPEDSHQ